MIIGFTEAEVLRILAGDAYKAWGADEDMRCGNLLRAMLDPDFRKDYRPALIVVPDTVRDAAPDLLEACERLLGWSFWESGGNAERDAQFARAAIAKAKGEA